MSMTLACILIVLVGVLIQGSRTTIVVYQRRHRARTGQHQYELDPPSESLRMRA